MFLNIKTLQALFACKFAQRRQKGPSFSVIRTFQQRYVRVAIFPLTLYSYFHFEKTIMLELCIKAIENQQLITLREIMLKFSFFLELEYHLPKEDFTRLLSAITYETVGKHESLQLDSRSIYLFSNSGIICRKDTQGKTQKCIRIREKMRGLTNLKSGNRVPQVKENGVYEIREFDSFQDMANNNYKNWQNIYYSSAFHPSVVLILDYSSISESLSMRIKQIHHEKMRFIADNNLFENVQRSVIMENLHRFQFAQRKFSEFLYHRRKAEESTFLIQKGQVEVLTVKGVGTSYVAQARSVLGYIRQQGESARCVSQRVECFVIQTVFLQAIISKKTLSKQPSNHKDSIKTQTVAGSRDSEESQSPYISEQSSNRAELFSRTDTFARRRGAHKSLAGSRLSEEKKQRQLQLRKHFSNFYNQIFNQFSEKKIKHMNLQMDDKQNLVLYKIKVLEKKMPCMDEIKHKLKKIRLEKLRLCKEKLQGSRHPDEIRNNGAIILTSK